MNMVHGVMAFDIQVKVNSEEENMGILEANYTFNPERMIAYKLVAIDSTGKEHVIMVNDAVNLKLDEFIEH
jgi:hypothetical protein